VSGQIRITLRKSPIGEKPRTREVLRGLGLRRMSSSVVREDQPAIQGMVAKVIHLVRVEPVADGGDGPGSGRP
jgi:large subunit ribosomal protein L30